MHAILFYGKCGLVLLALGMFGVVSAGCHTVEGAGRDVKAVGEGVEGAADETRPYNGHQRR